MVEDSPEAQLFVKRSLNDAHIEIFVASSLESVKFLILKNKMTFDLVILDLLTPGGDGFGVLKFLRHVGILPLVRGAGLEPARHCPEISTSNKIYCSSEKSSILSAC